MAALFALVDALMDRSTINAVLSVARLLAKVDEALEVCVPTTEAIVAPLREDYERRRVPRGDELGAAARRWRRMPVGAVLTRAVTHYGKRLLIEETRLYPAATVLPGSKIDGVAAAWLCLSCCPKGFLFQSHVRAVFSTEALIQRQASSADVLRNDIAGIVNILGEGAPEEIESIRTAAGHWCGHATEATDLEGRPARFAYFIKFRS
jgi:hypothetical protein